MVKFSSAFTMMLSVALILGSATQVSAEHPYHVSYAEIELNPDTGNLEVSLCVWPADLEKALGNMTLKPVDLDNENGLDEIISNYLKRSFACKNTDDETAEIRYVGHEIDLKKGWLYFEIQTAEQQGQWRLENRVFFELNEDQANHVQLQCNEKLERKVATLDDFQMPLSLNSN